MVADNFPSVVQEDQRLQVLRILREAPDYSASEHVVRQLLEGYGHRLSADRLRVQLAWLDEQGLILTGGGSMIRVPTLTQRGQDVASGAARHPGVARPEPL